VRQHAASRARRPLPVAAVTLLFLLLILIGTFGLLSAVSRLPVERRGQISLATVFLFTGLGHFVQTSRMAEMLPPFVPLRVPLVLLSGLFEWLLTIGLLSPRFARVGGMAAIAFLVLVFPGNIYAAMHRIDFGGHGAGPAYLLVRAPFQLLLIAWAYWFAVRRRG
jgi:uncharacterized membrane protein